MYDSNLSYSPPPPAEPSIEAVPQKHSTLGIVSFVLAILAMLIICFDLVLIFSLSGGLMVNQSYGWIDTVLSCLGGILALVALGLGIGALTQKNTKKTFGILGVVFSALFLLGYCAIIGINVISAL